MDKLWSFWKCICCENERRAYQSAVFVKETICCSRNIYNPMPYVPASIQLPFFVTGQYITSNVTSDLGITLDQGNHEYKFGPNETIIKSHNKETTTHFRVCCGCPVKDPEYTYGYSKERSIIYKTLPNRQGLHPYEAALLKMADFDNDEPIGVFKLYTFSTDAYEEQPMRENLYRKYLAAAKLSIPFLICTCSDSSYKPWLELVDYRYLSIKTITQKMTITEKMLKCGFLHVNAVLSNPEELANFRGFGLIIGEYDKNGFTFDRLIQEIELWKKKSPMSLECFGIQKHGIKFEASFPELLTQLKAYSPTGDIVRMNEAPFEVDALMLDKDKSSAVLFVTHVGICFVRGGIEKWIRVFEYSF